MSISIGAIAPLVDRVNRNYFWRVRNGVPSRRPLPLQDSFINAHLNDLGNNPRVGVCPMFPGQSTTKVAVLDMDSHKGEISWDQMCAHAWNVIVELQNSNLNPVPFRSSGGSGIHLIMLWDEPQDAYSVRETLKLALTKCGFDSGTKGVAQHEIEIFPKQNEIAPDRFGSMFVLPLAGKSCALDPDNDLSDIVPGLIKWRTSEPVEVREKPPIYHETDSSTIGINLSTLTSALDAIPNTDEEELDYDGWRNVIFGIHSCDPGPGGLVLAHDFSSKSSKYDPDFLDERVWPYITDRPDGITVRTIYNMAEVHGWVDPDVLAQFEAIDDNEVGTDDAPETKTSRFAYEDDSGFVDHPVVADLIQGVMPRAALGVIYGESGAGKSFLALDMACSIAREEAWRDLKTMHGTALYICAEGATGFRKRVRAYLQHHEIPTAGIKILAAAPNFMEIDDIKELIVESKKHKPMVIFVDTFARVIAGADENSAQDVGIAVKHCHRLHKATGATVVLIHHSGKDASKGARGSSALKAAADFELEVTRFNDTRTLSITKLKDGEDSAEFGFKLLPVAIDIDEDYNTISSCVVEHVFDGPKRAERQQRAPQGKNEQLAYDTFLDLLGVDSVDVSYTDLVVAIAAQMGFDETGGKRDRRRDMAQQAISHLVVRGAVTISENRVKAVGE